VNASETPPVKHFTKMSLESPFDSASSDSSTIEHNENVHRIVGLQHFYALDRTATLTLKAMRRHSLLLLSELADCGAGRQ
jgi:hypothetical protein